MFHEGRLILGLWDAFPVSPGHALLIPRRHVPTWFDATAEERAELSEATLLARREIERLYRPDGFNVGLNAGAAAGQTVFHLHIHVIPRYRDDVPDPRGGVRHVIPAKANYLAGPTSVGDTGADPGQGGRLVRGEWRDPLLPHLLEQLEHSSAADMAVAFVRTSGVELVVARLRELLRRGGRLRLIAGDTLGITQPEALEWLLDVGQTGDAQLHVFESAGTSFHPKAYLFHDANGAGTAFVGSSNLTHSALQTGIEWSYRVLSSADGPGFASVLAAFDALLRHPSVRRLDREWIEAYRKRCEALAPVQLPGDEAEPVRPHPVQVEALQALEQTRAQGNRAGLVVLATGLGKTWLAAFDSNRPEFQRILFVAHREEILDQARGTFEKIRPEARMGFYTGKEKAPDAEILFASIQTLGQARNLEQFSRDAFDYIVVDEFHHAAAATYRKLLAHFTPKFLLGLTATPERTDGGDLLGLCQENLVYRCDLSEGIRRGLLSPFHYFGVPDEVDYTNIPWRGRRFDEQALTAAVATRARAENALGQWHRRRGEKTLAFCCSQQHADFMASFFRDHAVRAVAVHSGPTSASREQSLRGLQRGDLDILFSVDLFNEGVDLPDVDTILMLRPTESRVVWLQQLGRGLRKSRAKQRLQVIDYIGNHRSFLIKAQTLLQPSIGDLALYKALQMVQEKQWPLPPGCEVTYELQAVEVLKGLLRISHDASAAEALHVFYEDFRREHEIRPRAAEAFHEGHELRSACKEHDSWLRYVAAKGDLSSEAQAVLAEAGPFLDMLENTSMSKSYKMVLLQAMLDADALPGQMTVDALAEAVHRIAGRSAHLRADFSVSLDDKKALVRLLEKMPITVWVGVRGATDEGFFTYSGRIFTATFTIPSEARPAFRELAAELIEWRLAEYLQRSVSGAVSKDPSLETGPADTSSRDASQDRDISS